MKETLIAFLVSMAALLILYIWEQENDQDPHSFI